MDERCCERQCNRIYQDQILDLAVGGGRAGHGPEGRHVALTADLVRVVRRAGAVSASPFL